MQLRIRMPLRQWINNGRWSRSSRRPALCRLWPRLTISAKAMAKCGIARPMALSWSMDSLRLTISTPFSRNQISASVSD